MWSNFLYYLFTQHVLEVKEVPREISVMREELYVMVFWKMCLISVTLLRIF
jgi:hypothetical protein